MKRFFAILVMISLIACNNSSDNDTGVITNSTDTINAAAPVDTNAKISDSVGTKMTTTTTTDTTTK